MQQRCAAEEDALLSKRKEGYGVAKEDSRLCDHHLRSTITHCIPLPDVLAGMQMHHVLCQALFKAFEHVLGCTRPFWACQAIRLTFVHPLMRSTSVAKNFSVAANAAAASNVHLQTQGVTVGPADLTAAYLCACLC